MGKITDVIYSANTSDVCIIGDFNAHPGRRFGNMLMQMCDTGGFIISDVALLPADTISYISAAHNTSSWLDHCVTTPALHSRINNICIPVRCAYDHQPVIVDFCINTNPATVAIQDNTTKDRRNRVLWDSAHHSVLHEYYLTTDFMLKNIHIPTDCVRCNDTSCSGCSDSIHNLYNDVVSALQQSEHTVGTPSRKERNEYFEPIAGWNDLVKDNYVCSRSWLELWVSMNKPRQGFVYEQMKISRARMKLAVKQCKNAANAMKSDKLAASLAANSSKIFWKNVKNYNANKLPRAKNIDNASNPTDICELWANHYSELFNCVKNDSKRHIVENKFREINYTAEMAVSVSEVTEHIRTLQKGKAPGPDGLKAEALYFSSPRVAVLLSLLFTAMNVHGVLPPNMIFSQLSPIIKDKCKSLSDKNNYRPICSATIISKLFELVLLRRCEQYLNTTENQFGFKSAHGTDMCIYVLKEIVNMYLKQNTPLFICFLDASKAFDRVNHYCLFDKLITRGVPVFIVRVLAAWYRQQKMTVKWGDEISRSFLVTNSVRQGGLMSPKLYNVYTDDLSKELSKMNIGPFIGQVRVNHLSFADDMNLIATTTRSLQILVNSCDAYAREHDIIFNALKTKCLYITPRKYKRVSFSNVALCDIYVERVDKIKYLGHTLTSCNTDNSDINNARFLYYARVNSLISKFHCCTEEVKRQLFKSYCSIFYCSALWVNFNLTTMHDLKVAYNNGFRKLMGLAFNCSASEMFALNRVDGFYHLLRKSCYSLMKRVSQSQNVIVRSMIVTDVPSNSRLWRNWRNVLYLHA